MSKSGKYYWVLAHVTPSYDRNGQIDGYHSNRRAPSNQAVEAISKLYDKLLAEEKRHANAKTGMEASYALLESILAEQKMSYSEFVWSVGK